MEKKMRYPVMTEKYLAERWQVSLKTLQRWRIKVKGRSGTSCSATCATTKPTFSNSSGAGRST